VGVDEPVARRVVVSGHVQGVFFRDSARREAHRRGVAGWVRNCPDGTVEAHFEGDAPAVEELVRWSRRGPRHATVFDVRVREAEPEGLSRFEIR
jgi:acylphosphatase